ncbi:MAG: asparagine synthase (glutamine-hydrolyzing) [Bdellovibrionota bacterium]
MCGITGTVGYNISEMQLKNSIASLKHRGPDGNGLYIDSDANVGLAHTRLSIIDLTTGAQPLYDDKREIVLICNGEIYDFERIREDLITKGHNFATKSDSEVIIYLYKEYGTEMFEHLRGEFAFILYDKKNQKVIVGRDRFGIKPLYIAEDNGKFVFSSEAKGIFATGLLKPQIDPIAIHNLLSFIPIDSLFKGLVALKPGCFLQIDLKNNSNELIRYLDIDLPSEEDEKAPGDLEACSRLVQDTFDEAVRLRMRADVPVGVYLSGGIDSAAVAGTIAKQHPNKLHAFTIAFTDSEEFNELELAEKMAKSINAELHVAKCDNNTLLENLSDCLWYSELPTPNLHGVGKFLLSALARKHVKVVLTGEGSDETFLGYDYFKDSAKGITSMFKTSADLTDIQEIKQDFHDQIGFVPQNEMLSGFHPKRQGLYKRMLHPKHNAKVEANSPMDLIKYRVDRKQVDHLPHVKKIQYYSIRGILGPYILSILGDRQEMAHAIEGRTPLLDHKLFEQARHIPHEFKINNGTEKYIFRHAMKDRVIPEIFANKKWPYAAPPVWVRKKTNPAMKTLVKKYLSRKAVIKAGIFNPRVVRRLRIVHAVIPFDLPLKRNINVLLMLIINIHILQDLYEGNFQKNIDKFAAVEY